MTKSLIDAQFGAEGVDGSSHDREISHALGFCIGFVVGEYYKSLLYPHFQGRWGVGM